MTSLSPLSVNGFGVRFYYQSELSYIPVLWIVYTTGSTLQSAICGGEVYDESIGTTGTIEYLVFFQMLGRYERRRRQSPRRDLGHPGTNDDLR